MLGVAFVIVSIVRFCIMNAQHYSERLKTNGAEIKQMIDHVVPERKLELEKIIPTLTMRLEEFNIDLSLFSLEIKDNKDNKEYHLDHETFLEWKKHFTHQLEIFHRYICDASVDCDNHNQIEFHANALQADTKASLERTSAVIQDARQLGIQTAIKLVEQNKQMSLAIEVLHENDSILERSNRILKRIIRKVQHDKCLWVFLAIVVALIIWIVVTKTGV